ncbi:hypothetical protein ABIA33_004999 [Streptacidiphilus sp. MAP12-16]|uniref:DUF5988 family protein n=1 Tax=Streptacidiphilus sp. MAP12-16 TaxID=3156300 RepID=UPI0035188ACC
MALRQAHPNVVLHGGSLIPEELRIRHIEDPKQVFKLPVANRYEHFEPSPDTVVMDGRELRVLVWVGRTYVAE